MIRYTNYQSIQRVFEEKFSVSFWVCETDLINKNIIFLFTGESSKRLKINRFILL